MKELSAPTFHLRRQLDCWRKGNPVLAAYSYVAWQDVLLPAGRIRLAVHVS